MSLPMRITFEGRDYTYTLLTKSISRATASIRIGLEGNEYEFVCNLKGEWEVADATVSDKLDLLRQIARIIRLRYKLY